MQQNQPTAVIILAAGSIKNKYQSYSFIYNSPALVPIASRSGISFILDFYYAHENVNVYVAINKEDEELFRRELVYYNRIILIPIAASSGVCDTLFQALAFVQENDIVVNLATTIPVNYPDSKFVFLDKHLSNNNYYSGVVFDDATYHLKSKTETGDKNFNAFTGVFRSEKVLLEKILEPLCNNNDLLSVVDGLVQLNQAVFSFTDWIDTGHEINYADARRKLISSRSFNSITVDNNTGILTKRSTNAKKLAEEKKYIGMLPEELQIRYPRLLHSDNSPGIMQMEYYGYPNLAEYQLYRSIAPLWWSRIFDSLAAALIDMQRYHFSIGPTAWQEFYLDKNLQRVDAYLDSLASTDFFVHSDTLMVNGFECVNIRHLRNKIRERILEMYQEDDFCIMHGDFCFNNILFDTFSNTIKLIDPRGSFGEKCQGIYGDRKYDLAKLMHSSIGHYDYIVNNLFQVDEHNNSFNYSFPLRENQSILDKLSYELMRKLDAKANDILFIVGLLFLSMCPLHNDNPRRQRLMYAHGLFYINKYID